MAKKEEGGITASPEGLRLLTETLALQERSVASRQRQLEILVEEKADLE